MGLYFIGLRDVILPNSDCLYDFFHAEQFQPLVEFFVLFLGFVGVAFSTRMIRKRLNMTYSQYRLFVLHNPEARRFVYFTPMLATAGLLMLFEFAVRLLC